MPFGNANIIGTSRHGFHQDVHRTTTGHCRRNTHNTLIGNRQFKKGFSKHILKFRRTASRSFFYTLAGFFVKQPWCMPLRGSYLGRFETFALHGMKMKKFWTSHFFYFTQNAHQFLNVMSIRWPEIADVHTLKNILLVGQQRFHGIIETQNATTTIFIEQSPF